MPDRRRYVSEEKNIKDSLKVEKQKKVIVLPRWLGAGMGETAVIDVDFFLLVLSAQLYKSSTNLPVHTIMDCI